MPDRYDRAECATELRVRAEIIGPIQDGWRPAKSFGIPSMEMQRAEGERQKRENESTDSECSGASEMSLSEKITDLYDFV